MPFARYSIDGACGIAWHRQTGLTRVAACGVYSAGCRYYSAGIVGWLAHTGTRIEGPELLCCLLLGLEVSRGWLSAGVPEIVGLSSPPTAQLLWGGWGVLDGREVLDLMHDRIRMTIGPRIPTMPGRSMFGFFTDQADIACTNYYGGGAY